MPNLRSRSQTAIEVRWFNPGLRDSGVPMHCSRFFLENFVGLFAALILPFLTLPVDARGDEPPLERVRTIALKGPTGGLDHLALDAKRARLLIANAVNDSLDVVDLKGGKVMTIIAGSVA
ncbi:MAG TPA: hypothetical protein VHS97_15535, partial [Isosphaeraceae bacterium]|nr:hypothetical protein [Isosphaeraceae bacterium]